MPKRLISGLLISFLILGTSPSFSDDIEPPANPAKVEIAEQEMLTNDLKKRIDHLAKIRPNFNRQLKVVRSNWLLIKPTDHVGPFKTAYRLVEVQVLTLEKFPLICSKGRTTKKIYGPFQKCPPGFKAK